MLNSSETIKILVRYIHIMNHSKIISALPNKKIPEFALNGYDLLHKTESQIKAEIRYHNRNYNGYTAAWATSRYIVLSGMIGFLAGIGAESIGLLPEIAISEALTKLQSTSHAVLFGGTSVAVLKLIDEWKTQRLFHLQQMTSLRRIYKLAAGRATGTPFENITDPNKLVATIVAEIDKQTCRSYNHFIRDMNKSSIFSAFSHSKLED
jgi:hypothetical protein